MEDEDCDWLGGDDDDADDLPPMHYAQFIHLTPRATPDWRWVRAGHLAAGRADGLIDDPLTLRAAAFRRNPDSMLDPPLAAAAALHQADGTERAILAGYILARLTPAAAAAKAGVDTATAEVFAAVFFDVAGRLDHEGWVVAYAIGREPPAPVDITDFRRPYRAAGYAGGERALDAILAATTGAGRDQFDAVALDAAELDALSFQLRAADGVPLFRLNLRLQAEAAGMPPATYHLPSRGRTPAEMPGDSAGTG